MDPLLVVSGLMMTIGATYWWQQKIASVAGADGMNNSFGCLISAGMKKCPDYLVNVMPPDSWAATLLFYVGMAVLLYTFFFPKPPRTPPNPL